MLSADAIVKLQDETTDAWHAQCIWVPRRQQESKAMARWLKGCRHAILLQRLLVLPGV